ncbi:RNA polymerase recycling motor HelD [Bacillus gobiensis]|uniref:RNA polymerase recycling motor HelD n=1 Tax=Bacillus gobiensis TaxID=1441095 RepID=UPI003D2234A7
MDNQKGWQEEQSYLNEVLRVIEGKGLDLNERAGTLKEDVLGIKKTFWDDVTLNFEDAEEALETMTSIKQQTEFLSERERSHKQIDNELKALDRVKRTPYFGRVDFLEDGDQTKDVIYIGIHSVMDEKDENFIIYDWRAPISSLYYNYSPGKAMYTAPQETITGEMLLKRQYVIKNGKLQSMFDAEVTIGDALLQTILGERADEKMKSIVSTIQREQNEIIRNEKADLLIVQGAAGSGKTSAALQRVAYLLYRYRGEIQSENIMLFSPNFLFNSYVSTVLPELGEENMEQTTFQEYTNKRLGREFELEGPFEQTEYMITAEEDNNFRTRRAAIEYKASNEFISHLDQYIEQLSESGMIFRNISFRGAVLISSEEIGSYFYSLDKNISIPNRITLTSEWLLKKVKKEELKERERNWVIDEIALLSKEDYLNVYKKLQEKGYDEDSFEFAEAEERLMAKQVVGQYFKPIRKAIRLLRFLDIKSIYIQFFEQEKTEIGAITVENLKKNRLYYEDTTPYLYLNDLLKGSKKNTAIRHLFIDEAQDYSAFQLAYLRQLFPSSKWTVLGDFNQTVFAHSIKRDSLLAGELFNFKQAEKLTLKKTYRSTKEITKFTSRIIKGEFEIKPFNRSGKEPVVTVFESNEQMIKSIADTLTRMNKKHTSIAVICKSAKDSQKAFSELKPFIDLKLIDNEKTAFEKGIIVIPVYLAKGIEFDAVVIYNASDQSYSSWYDSRLLYTACTRAMHELELFSAGEPSRFLP